MGRIIKRFSAKTSKGAVKGSAKIDSGADSTILRFDAACELGLDTKNDKIGAMRAADGGRLTGFYIPIKLRIDARQAEIEAFVPVFVNSQEMLEKDQKHLVGADFLQEAKVILDYSKPHKNVFGSPGFRPDWQPTKITPEEIKLLRRRAKCRKRSR